MTQFPPQERPDSPINAGGQLMTLTIETLAEAVLDVWNSDEMGRAACLTAARNALTAIEQAGYVVAPRELTDEMRAAVVHLDCTSRLDPTWPEYWSAMLSAAPKIQHSEGEGR